jgi:hypothetical protein
MSLTFQSTPVFDFRPNWEEIMHGQLDDTTFDGVGLGLQTPWKPTTKIRRKATVQLMLDGRDKITEFRQWIVSRGTRRDCFWFPLHLNDYGIIELIDEMTGDVVNQAPGETQIRIKNIGLTEKFTYGQQFKYLALLTPTKIECYEIQLVEDFDEYELVTLTEGLTTELDASETMCCGLMLARLADDAIDFTLATDGCATVSLNVVELPAEFDESETFAPLHLYRITRGSTSWHYTNWPESVTAASRVWTPINIDHGDFEQNSEFHLQPLRITVATDDENSPFRAAIDRNISEITIIEVYETDFNSLGVTLSRPLYRGRMGKCEFSEKGQIQVELSTILRIGEQMVPTTMIQRPCGNRLFDSFCRVSPAAFVTLGTITTISEDPPYIEATEFGDKATAESDVNWFALGKVTVGNETRFCLGQSGNRLYLNWKFQKALVGSSVAAFAGCDKRLTTCAVKFSNEENYMGFSVIPNKEPQFELLSQPKPTGGKK